MTNQEIKLINGFKCFYMLISWPRQCFLKWKYGNLWNSGICTSKKRVKVALCWALMRHNIRQFWATAQLQSKMSQLVTAKPHACWLCPWNKIHTHLYLAIWINIIPDTSRNFLQDFKSRFKSVVTGRKHSVVTLSWNSLSTHVSLQI